VGATETTAPAQFSFGVVTTYLRKPVVLRSASPSLGGADVPAVDHLVGSSFLWAVGVADRLELTLAMPVGVYQTGTGVSAFSSSQVAPLPETVVRDFRYGLAWALVPRPRAFPGSPWALTARFEMAAPVGDERSFAGDRAAVWVPTLAADYRRGRWFAGAEVGARVRNATNLAGVRVGTQAVAALGLGFDILRDELLSTSLEAIALPTLVRQQALRRDPVTSEVVADDADRRQVPAEWLATVRTAPTPGGDFSFSVSAGTALPLTSTPSVTAPAYRVVAGLRYAPLGRDSDGDGVLDKDDLCPGEREDRDGFQDEDGCPDPDNDRDGIPDSADRCRDRAEDHDGFRDEDGCPDLDDDGDGIPDELDRCRSRPEDRDGFQDEDGCPDPDNDGDGIPDVKDKCPNAAEDLDGFHDDDGCPDPDNDMDGVLDAQDRCPDSREDKDGFQDDDGCPDPDNDMDGVPDAEDKCPNEPETIDGVDDADGCPEPGAVERTRVSGMAISVAAPARFAPGSAKVAGRLGDQLAMIAQRARGMQPVDRVIIQTFGDAPGESAAAVKLASARADAIRGVFVKAGFAPAAVTAAVGELAAKRPAGSPQYEVLVQRGKWP
jgi:outer membrane protein OmpA-like peptidoglycan-associated protein